MEQIHKRVTAEQVKTLLKGYRQGILDRATIEEFILSVAPLNRVGLPEDIKGLTVYLASEASSFVNRTSIC